MANPLKDANEKTLPIQQQTTSSTHNGGSLITPPTSIETAAAAMTASLAANLTSGDAKTLLTSLLGATNQANLQMLAAASISSNVQRLPSLKPIASPSTAPVGTTPTQVTPSSGRKRGRPPASSEYDESVKRKKVTHSSNKSTTVGTEKQSKGLRHFSQLVCEKVREKGVTTYNEVADELVKELGEAEKKAGQDGQIDQKNIRRRVYDALNVLMAMNIINKEKKEIQWIGLPTNSIQECEHIQNELSQYEERISKKTTELHELVLQILTLKNLIRRNRSRSESGDAPSHHSAIGLPFILVNTHKQTTIDCSISSDKSEYVFTFDNTFELYQDVEVLNKMGLDCGLHSGKCTPDSLSEAKAMLPKVFEPILEEMATLAAAPQSPNMVDDLTSTVTSTPMSSAVQQQQRSTNEANPLTPLLSEHSNGTSSTISTTSPLALAAAALASTHNPASVAAAISTLQQLQQIQMSTPPTTTSASVSSSPFRGGTVTARPLNFVPSPNIVRSGSITNASSTSPSINKSNTGGIQLKSPIVTVQPLANITDMIATLQSSILKQQHLINSENSVGSSHPPPATALPPNGLPSNKQDQVEQINTFLTPSNPPL